MPDEKIKVKDNLKKGKRNIVSKGLILILLVDIFWLLVGIYNKDFRAFSIGFIGIFTFFGILRLMNYLTNSGHLDEGEMRKAIAASFIVIYFALLSLFTFEEIGTSYTGVFRAMIDHFTYLVGIIVVFYFGSRSVEEYMKNKVKLEELQQSKGKKNK